MSGALQLGGGGTILSEWQSRKPRVSRQQTLVYAPAVSLSERLRAYKTSQALFHTLMDPRTSFMIAAMDEGGSVQGRDNSA